MATAAPGETTPRLMSVTDAAAQLGVSRNYMYALVKGGAIASVQMPTTTGRQRGALGWGIRIEQSAIDAFIERNRVATA